LCRAIVVKDVDVVGRKIALQLQSLMAIVEFKYNRHEPCLVCKNKFMHHVDGLPCEDDNSIKERAPVNSPVMAKKKPV